MRHLRLFSLTMCVLGLWASYASADGWLKIPNLNPFSKGESEPAERVAARTDSTSARPTGGWDWRKRPATEPATAANASIWQRIKGGASKAARRTKAVLIPWKKEASNQRSLSGTGTRRVYQPAWKQKKEQQSSGFFSRLFAPKPPERPQTVSEWIGQPRP